MSATDPANEATTRILIIYYSRFGVVKRLADCIAEGARRVERTEVDFLEVEDRQSRSCAREKTKSRWLAGGRSS